MNTKQKMRAPMLYLATAQVLKSIAETQTCLPDGRWQPARPLSWSGFMLRHRLKCAWNVFTGRWDVLRWAGDQ
jgi:hypothetical protein